MDTVHFWYLLKTELFPQMRLETKPRCKMLYTPAYKCVCSHTWWLLLLWSPFSWIFLNVSWYPVQQSDHPFPFSPFLFSLSPSLTDYLPFLQPAPAFQCPSWALQEIPVSILSPTSQSPILILSSPGYFIFLASCPVLGMLILIYWSLNLRL